MVTRSILASTKIASMLVTSAAMIALQFVWLRRKKKPDKLGISLYNLDDK